MLNPSARKDEDWLRWEDAYSAALRLAPKVVLKLQPPRAYDPPGYKTYEVSFGKTLLGRVYNVRESNHRKAGRLICGTTYSKKWEYDMAGGFYKRVSGLYYTTRKEAVVNLLTDLIRRGAYSPARKNKGSR